MDVVFHSPVRSLNILRDDLVGITQSHTKSAGKAHKKIIYKSPSIEADRCRRLGTWSDCPSTKNAFLFGGPAEGAKL